MKTNAPHHIGIDAHKRFSQVHGMDRDGNTAWKGRIENHDPASIPGMEEVVMAHAASESAFNWGNARAIAGNVRKQALVPVRELRMRGGA